MIGYKLMLPVYKITYELFNQDILICPQYPLYEVTLAQHMLATHIIIIIDSNCATTVNCLIVQQRIQ